MTELVYRIQFTEQAAAARDELAPDRRALLLKGLDRLAHDPRRKRGTTQVGTNEDYRKAMVTHGMLIEYVVVHEAVVVVVLELFDESQYLADDTPA